MSAGRATGLASGGWGGWVAGQRTATRESSERYGPAFRVLAAGAEPLHASGRPGRNRVWGLSSHCPVAASAAD